MVTFGDTITATDLIATVEKTGYTAKLPPPPQPAGNVEDSNAEPADELQMLRTRVWVSLVLTVPVIAMAMVPALQFTYWQWLSLTLAAPVVVYGGLPFHRAAWVTARRRWTLSCPSARSPRSGGRCGHCSSAPPARPV
jgi:Cu+-exporting ATPase